jgi:hypothetical protein
VYQNESTNQPRLLIQNLIRDMIQTSKIVTKNERMGCSALGCQTDCHLRNDGFEVVVCYMGRRLVVS